MLFEMLERVFVTLKHVFGTCSLFVLSPNGWKDQNMDSSFSGQRKPIIWRRHCSIGQSCYSMTSKRIDWFLESLRAWFFFCLFVCLFYFCFILFVFFLFCFVVVYIGDITWPRGDTKFLFECGKIFHEWAKRTSEIFF